MKNSNCVGAWLVCFATAAAMGVCGAVSSAAQTPAAAPRRAAMTAPDSRATSSASAAAPSEQDVADAQEQLLKLLRLSPTLTTVVARDPSLLADQPYVQRNNPELAQFLATHPDIAQNPEFYLFSNLDPHDGRRDRALERAVWPEFSAPQHQSVAVEFVDRLGPVIGVFGFFLAVVWIVRLFVDSRRWSRAFTLQSDVHARLIDKFSTSQELAAYMETEAGKRFLEGAPIQLGAEAGSRMPNAVARILTPLQIGVVMALLGAGLLALRHAGPDTYEPMLVLGMIVLMPGIGFILSAAVTWVLARRLGMLPDRAAGGLPGSRESL
jgi:hypothetical protein